MDRHEQLGGDLAALLRQFRNRRVLVVGDGGNDVWYDVTKGRDFEEGTPTVNLGKGDITPAMASFVARQCQSLGAATLSWTPGGNLHIRYVGDGIKFGVRNTGACEAFEHRSSRVDTVNAVVISDYGKGVCTPEVCRAIIDAANEHKIPVLVDPARGADWSKYAGATVIKASAEESGEYFDDPWLVQTLGQLGMVIANACANPPVIPAHTPAGPFVDAIGCGDICAAVLGLTLAVGAPLLDGCRLAAVVAGMKTQYRGCRAITAEEVERELAAQTKAATG